MKIPLWRICEKCHRFALKRKEHPFASPRAYVCKSCYFHACEEQEADIAAEAEYVRFTDNDIPF